VLLNSATALFFQVKRYHRLTTFFALINQVVYTQVILLVMLMELIVATSNFFPFLPFSFHSRSLLISDVCGRKQGSRITFFKKMVKKARFYVHIFARNAIAIKAKLRSMATTRPKTYLAYAHAPRAPDCRLIDENGPQFPCSFPRRLVDVP